MGYRLVLVFSIVLGSIFVSNGQNLVSNPSFENNTGIPSGPAQWSFCNGWNSINNIIPSIYPAGTPDYFHTSAVGLMNLPNSVYGTINPRTGNAVMGITVAMEFLPDHHEYIAKQLSTPLTVGETYEVSFWVANAIKSGTGDWGMNNLGVHLSVGPLTQTGHELIAVTPQWISSSVIHTNNTWQQVTFQFVATAPLNWITIGHFDLDANTTFQLFGAPAPLFRAINYYFDDISVEEITVLPITLTLFDAKRTGDNVDLNWTTSTEMNHNFFVVERSPDAQVWEHIGEISGAGFSNEILDYNFVDGEPLTNEITYYRLKQVDFDGKFSYSHIVNVKTNFTKNDLLVYPNPTTNYFNIVNSSNLDISRIEIISLEGYSSKKVNQSLNKIDISNLSKGTYILKVHFTNGKISTQRISKL